MWKLEQVLQLGCNGHPKQKEVNCSILGMFVEQ